MHAGACIGGSIVAIEAINNLVPTGSSSNSRASSIGKYFWQGISGTHTILSVDDVIHLNDFPPRLFALLAGASIHFDGPLPNGGLEIPGCHCHHEAPDSSDSSVGRAQVS